MFILNPAEQREVEAWPEMEFHVKFRRVPYALAVLAVVFATGLPVALKECALRMVRQWRKLRR